MKARDVVRDCRITHWAEIIKQRSESGLTVNEFCQSRGLSRNQYFYWLRILRDSACEHLVKNSTQIEHKTPMFTEVTVAKQLIEPSALVNESSGEIRIEAGGIKITADSRYPTEKIATLLRGLQTC